MKRLKMGISMKKAEEIQPVLKFSSLICERHLNDQAFFFLEIASIVFSLSIGTEGVPPMYRIINKSLSTSIN